jgi:hypothetical protein
MLRDAKEMQGVPDKFEKFFSPNPARAPNLACTFRL